MKFFSFLLTLLLITPTYAQTASEPPQPGIGSLMPLVLIFAIFYFFVIRPQGKKIKDHAEMVKGIERGDKVVTSGGIIGVITKITDDNTVELEIADGVKVELVKTTISETLVKAADAPKAKRVASSKSKTSTKK